jgi:hypothetical protein
MFHERRMPSSGEPWRSPSALSSSLLPGGFCSWPRHAHFPIIIVLWCVGFGFFGLLALEAATSRGQIRLDAEAREIVFVSRGLGLRQRPLRFPVSEVSSVLVRQPADAEWRQAQTVFCHPLRRGRGLCADLAFNEVEAAPRAIANALAIDRT